jgi:uncharacterized protein YkwD
MTRHNLIAAAVVVLVLTGVWYSSREPAPAVPAEPLSREALPQAAALITTVTPSPTSPEPTTQPEPALEVVSSPTADQVVPEVQPTIAPSPVSNPQSPPSTPEPLPPTAPPAPTTAPPAPPADSSIASAEQNAIEQVNYQRSLYGLPPLAQDSTLMQLARGRADDMAARGYFGHFDPVTRVELGRSSILNAGYANGSENIYRSGGELMGVPVQAVGWFMTDDIHREAILNTFYTAVGAGIAADGPYWNIVILFAR